MKLWNLLALSLLTSCGYRWNPDYPQGQRPTVTVPFAIGDEEGQLTAEMIRVLSTSGLVDVVSSGGDYALQVTIQSDGNETTGYRRDPQKVDGRVRKNLLAVEGRRSMTIEAALCRGEEVVYGPYQITADADYDYVDQDSIQDLTFVNPQGGVVTVLPFSLGQLEPIEAAQEATNRPLYQRLSQKIVDALSSEW